MRDDGRTSRLWLPYAVDIVAPFLAYVVVHAFGAGAMWALSIAGLLAGASTVVNSVRRRALDAVGALVLLELLASIVLLAVVHDARLLLIRPSFYTGIAAVYLLASAAGTPLSYIGSRPMAARGGPARLAAYERAWTSSPEFRRTHRMVTAGFGVALALDSVLRVLIVYRTPLERAVLLSNVPHVVAIVLMVVCSALAGRRFGRLVDAEMRASA